MREVLVTLALTPTRIGIPSRIWRANCDFRNTAAMSVHGANPKRENARVAAAMWGGADAFEQCARDAGWRVSDPSRRRD